VKFGEFHVETTWLRSSDNAGGSASGLSATGAYGHGRCR